MNAACFKMKINSLVLKISACLMLVVFINLPVKTLQAAVRGVVVTQKDEPPVSVAEVRYEKLMKIYMNKIKLAFSESDDARSLEILNQFLPEFSQKTQLLKKDLLLQLKDLSPAEKNKVMDRVSQRVNVDELMALLFDERVSGRMAANPEIKFVMDQLYAKSIEVQKPVQEFIAVD